MLRKGLISAALLLLALGASAQRRASADVEVKTLADGKVTTVTKRVFCQGNGRLVTVFSTPYSYTTVTNLKGEFKLYVPSSNEVFSRVDQSFGSGNELLYLFLAGRQDNLGLLGLGYTLQSSSFDEEGYLKRTYTTKKKDSAPILDGGFRDAGGLVRLTDDVPEGGEVHAAEEGADDGHEQIVDQGLDDGK